MTNRPTGRPTAPVIPLLLALGLGACSTLGLGASSGPQSLFDLAVPNSFDADRRVQAQLLVPVPVSSDALANARVAVRDGGAVTYMPAVAWSDQLPSLVQTTLVRAFENSGRVKAVGRPGESLAIDDQVIVDIRAFELDVTGTPTARVAFGVKLLDDRSGKVRASRVIEASRPAASDSPADAVRALDAAASSAVSELVTWTVGAL